jgi:putative ABC transport system ATP-binding protein
MIRIDGARKFFHRGTPDERAALDGVSLGLDDGSFAVVIGSNGAGKSTLLGALAGSVALDEGSIRIDGTDVTRWSQLRRAALVARVLQDPMQGTFPELSIEENLALAEMRTLGRGLAPALTPSRRARHAGLLAGLGMGLESRMAARVALLSGGQRQALALAMAVMNAPRMLLLDEHAASLDPRTAEVVMQATLAAVSAAGLTTLMVTHNMQHAIRYGDRLIMLDAGRVRLDVRGEEKRSLTIDALVERFHIADDRMLLG